MKKYLLSALALPLLFACSSEDYLDQKATDNDQFAGIEKVDATFTLADMDEGSSMRLATQWGAELNDRLGFAWLTDGTVLTQTGDAYQNHPLFLKQEGKGYKFVPETSIYVGKYFVYYPYDETTVDIGKINFTSLEEQPLKDGIGGGNYEALAEKSINIGDKWTNVTKAGTADASDPKKFWEKAGIDQNYHLYAAPFSNQTGLDLTYQKNNPTFGAAERIQGATDIDFTIEAGEEVGAAAIYEATVQLVGASKSFTYGPTAASKEPIQVAGVTVHNANFWADKSNVATAYDFDFSAGAGAITLKAEDEKNGVTTKDKTTGWFWFNSLPVDNGMGKTTTNVNVVLETSYGKVTVPSTPVGTCAYAFDNYANTTGVFDKDASNEWIKLVSTADNATTKEWNLDGGTHMTFINQYGDHKGKYALTVDFSTGDMATLHIKSDSHLQTVLRYYIATGKSTAYVLNLDKDAAGEFKISKKSIALLQTINRSGLKLTVKPCALDAAHAPTRIVVAQDGTEGKTEVPDLDNVFAAATHVYLSKDCDWTWKERTGTNTLTIDANVSAITNEGTLTVNATNIELSTNTVPLYNAAGATMNITKVTTVKDALTNLGTINVGSESNKAAELRAYDVAIDNDATGLNEGEYGVINNYGVVGVTDGTSGKFNNYGFIDMTDANAITLLSTNELTSNFDDAFNASTNKMGTVKLPNNNPLAIVSVANKDANGFIRYTWPADQTTYVTPAGNVKYNTIVVSGNIEFTEAEKEIQYIAFTGVRTQVINKGYLTSLKGIMVDNDDHNASIIIEKGNMLNPKNGTFLGTGATVYYGGQFTHNAKVVGTTASNYFGTWSTDQIVKY